MTKSPPVDLELLDLKQEEKVADDQSVFKEEFSGYVSQVDEAHVKDVGSTHCVDIDTVGGENKLDEGFSAPSVGLLEDKFDNKEKDCEPEAVQQANSIMHENHSCFSLNEQKCKGSVEPEMEDTSASGGVPSPGMSQMDLAPSGSPSSNESIDDVYSEADQYMNESSPSSPDSRIAENSLLNGYGAEHCIGDFDMEKEVFTSSKKILERCESCFFLVSKHGIDRDIEAVNHDDANMEVVLYPDYVTYQGKYYMGPQLTFSHCCIKINGSIECVNQGAFNCEWAVDELIDIKCQFIRSMEAVVIKLQINVTSGIEVLKIVVADSNWSVRHKQIISLNEKYLAKWTAVIEADIDGEENVLLEPKCYFPNFDEPFDEVVYPKGDPDAVSISKRDVDLLQPDTFINDTVIDFYIKYLKNQIQEEEKHRFHFFNSFFFRKLADMDKNPSSASDGKAAFLRVRKWTRKINLFKKDYIFIPVNFNLHWSLIVICHPGEVVSLNDEDLDKSVKLPCILHMDSIKGSHSGLKNLIRSYLWEEWKERQKDKLEEDDLSSNFLNMRFLPLTLPQQENCYDCGLFLLHYLELFLAEAPIVFNPLKLTKFSSFLNADWFPPAEAYLKRTLIQRLIFELLENRSREVFSSNCGDENHYSENNENQTHVEFIAEECSQDFNQESTNSHSSQGIEITLLSASSSLNPQSFNNSGLVLRDLFEPGATTGALPGECQSFDHRSSDYHLNGSIFPMEEDTETGEQFMYITTDANFQQASGVTPQTCELPLLSRDYGYETCQKPEISLMAELGQAPLSQDTSSCASDESDDVGIIENCTIGNEGRESEEAKEDERNCSSMENLDSVTEITGFAALGHEGGAYEEAKLDEENCSSMGNLEFLTEITVSVATSNEGEVSEETKQDEKNHSSVENLDGLTRVSGSAAIDHEGKASGEAKLVEENCSSMEAVEFLTEITVSASTCNEGKAFEETKQDEKNCSSVENLDGLTEVTGSTAIGHEGKASEEAKLVEENCSSMEKVEFSTEITVSATTCSEGGVFKETKQDEKNSSSVENLDGSIEVSAAIDHEGKASEEAKLVEENCSSMEDVEFLTEITISAATCNEGGAFEETKQGEKNCSSVENLEGLTEITGSAAISHEGKASEEAMLVEENCSSMENEEFLTEITVSAHTCNEGGVFEETKPDEKNNSSVENLDGLTEITGCAAIGPEGKASEEAKQEVENCSFMECSTQITVSAPICNVGGQSEEAKPSEENCSSSANSECSREITAAAATINGASSEKAEQNEGNCLSVENLECPTEITVSAATSIGEGASKEPKQDEKASPCTEDLMSCTEVADSAASNLPIDSVVESSQDISMMSNGNDEILHSSQETLAVPQPQFSNAMGDKRICDEVHMIDDMKSDTSEEQAAKKRRLMPLEDESDYKSIL